MSRKWIFIAVVLLLTAGATISVQRATAAEAKRRARHGSFHKAVAKSPAPGTIFLYPERIPLKDGGFVVADRGIMFVPANRSDPKSAVIEAAAEITGKEAALYVPSGTMENSIAVKVWTRELDRK